jgi:hypothetical protein
MIGPHVAIALGRDRCSRRPRAGASSCALPFLTSTSARTERALQAPALPRRERDDGPSDDQRAFGRALQGRHTPLAADLTGYAASLVSGT